MAVRHVSTFQSDHCRERARTDERMGVEGVLWEPTAGIQVRDVKAGGRVAGRMGTGGSCQGEEARAADSHGL